MSMHRALSVLAVCVAGAVGLAAPPGAGAQTITTETTTTDTTAAAAPASVPATATSSATVSVSGTVSGLPESVSLSGRAQIASRTVWSERNTADPAAVTLDIDLSGLSGKGSSSGAKYVTAAREVSLRRLSASDLVEITFAFQRADGSSGPRAGIATFSLLYDVNTGVLTSATGRIGGM